MPDFDLADIPPDRSKKPSPKPMFRALRIFLVVAAAVVVLLVALVTSFYLGIIPGFRAYRMTANSMAPTLLPGDRLVADMHYFPEHPAARGDLVIFRFPTPEGETLYLKRVIALPGDVISGTPETVVLNGQPLREPYVNPESQDAIYDSKATFGPLTVPASHVFLMGDNRQHSYDSRHFGLVPVGRLVGKPLYISWSKELNRIGSRVE